jgi:hypothetical protein
MYCDGILHEKEMITLQQIAINMDWIRSNKRVLKLMQNAPNAIIDGAVECFFREQYN